MPNYDPETGIRFGVISPHSISPYALDDIYTNGTDPQYESAKQGFRQKVFDVLNEYLSTDECDNLTDQAIEIFNERFESDGSGIMDYSDSEYTLHVSGDNFGIFVMKSPYYTYCRGCSPCAPGAGDLDHPMTSYIGAISTNFDKALCLGPDWFNKDNPIPYRVFRVDNDQEVI